MIEINISAEQYLESNELSLHIQNTQLLNGYQKTRPVSFLREDS